MRRRFSICAMTLALLLGAAGQAVARTISVHSAADVNKTWQAGDTLVWTDGEYNGKVLTLKGSGSAEAPIVLRAQTSRQVALTTKSRLTIDGTYIEVHGFVFKGTNTGTDHVIQFSSASSHCRLSDCSIESFNPTDLSLDFKWISLRGRYNRVDHCSFENKTNSGTLLVVWLENGVVPYHTIDHNHFHRRTANLDSNGKELNGQEIIRIGDSSTSMQTAACTVEGNLFEECDGEIETISNKSCGNIYRGNRFVACSGMLTLRHGNNCIVEGNYFAGNDKSGSGGVRIIGEGHTVINNYFEALAGTNYRAGICIVRGKENSALNEYFQVKDAIVSHNIFVNCKEAFCINYHSSEECTLAPENVTIEDNTVYNDAGNSGNRIVNIAQEGGSIAWTENRYNAGKWKNYTPATPAWICHPDMTKPETEDPGMATGGPSAITIPSTQKRICNGRLVIETAGGIYTATGQMIHSKY